MLLETTVDADDHDDTICHVAKSRRRRGAEDVPHALEHGSRVSFTVSGKLQRASRRRWRPEVAIMDPVSGSPTRAHRGHWPEGRF